MAIKAGIIGGAGYTGGEVLRILLQHPNVEIQFIESKSQKGKKVTEIHTDLLGDTDLCFTCDNDLTPDVLFLCLGHGEAANYIAANPPALHTRIIDLSQDHRLTSDFGPGGQSTLVNPEAFARLWVYGLPESNREKIKTASYIANPGCFATAIQLGLLPLAFANILSSDIHISATTGSTGAGQALSAATHFTWRNDNLSTYKVFEHQHLAEIIANLNGIQKAFSFPVHFIPNRGCFTRGIHATLYTSCSLKEEEAHTLYSDYYREHPFVHISKNAIDLKQVINTNKCILQIQKKGNLIFITSIIDNLLKGAAGQAVQNMNILFDLEEKTGLMLKASVF